MRLIILLTILLTFNSCNSEEKTDKASETRSIERGELSKDSKVFLGNRLFSEKTCITCHALEGKKIGPSVVDIMRIYNENNANIEEFLRGKSGAIVDTNESQIAIMQANIEGFLTEVTDEEINAISFYMQHVLELKSK
jgi:cytochrome c